MRRKFESSGTAARGIESRGVSGCARNGVPGQELEAISRPTGPQPLVRSTPSLVTA